jgi:hypothetical protein
LGVFILWKHGLMDGDVTFFIIQRNKPRRLLYLSLSNWEGSSLKLAVMRCARMPG